MTEYIKRQDAIDAIKSVPTGNWSSKRYAGEIERIQPAAVRPVVRGEWIDDGCITRCKYCGEEKEFPHWRFCPNCGADMREETKE